MELALEAKAFIAIALISFMQAKFAKIKS